MNNQNIKLKPEQSFFYSTLLKTKSLETPNAPNSYNSICVSTEECATIRTPAQACAVDYLVYKQINRKPCKQI